MAITQPQEFPGAVRGGDIGALRRFVREQPALANTRDPSGVSAVMLTMYHGHADAARLLAEVGAEIGPFEACVLGQADCLKAMLAADRDLIGRYSPDGFTLLHLAAFFGQPKVAEMLLAAGAEADAEARNKMRVRPLHSAAAADQTRIALVLIAPGADVNACQEGGFAPLHAAAQNGNLDLVHTLFDHGAEVSPLTDDGKTPVELARERGHMDAVLLLEARAITPQLRPSLATQIPNATDV
jgi:ankyrin repeat protein